MTDHQKLHTVQGTVERISSNETVRVTTKVTKVHPIYRKRFTQTKHFLVHNPGNKAKVGDEVTIVACKPISKMKRWTIQS